MAATAPRLVAPDRDETSRSGAWLTDILLFLMALIWGVNYSIVKFGTRNLAPLGYNAIRITLAAACFVLIAWVAATRDGGASARVPSVKDRWALIGLGMIGHGIYQLFFILGLSRSRAGTVALVLGSGPAFSAIMGRLRGSEIVSRRGWLGIALQITGVASVVLGSSTSTTRGDTTLGSLLILTGTLSWAYYAVLVKPYTDRVPSVHLGAFTLIGGAVFVVAAALPTIGSIPFQSIDLPVWGAIVYSGLGALVIANLFWFRGVRVLGPTHTAMFSNIQPAIALAVAWIALGEVPTVWQLVGAATIMGGLLISRT